MSKGTKKLDAAIMVAMAEVLPVENDSNDKETGEPYASSAAVLDEARRVMVEAGLVHLPIGFEVGRFANRDCQVLVLVLKHVGSGQSRTYRGPRYAADVTKSPAFEAGGVAKGSLRSILQGVFLITAESPPVRSSDAPRHRAELHDRSERPEPTGERAESLERMLGKARPDRVHREETEEQLRHEIEVICIGLDGSIVEEAKEHLAKASCRKDYLEIRDVLLKYDAQKDRKAEAAGESDTPLSDPAASGPLDAPTKLELILGRLPDVSARAQTGECEAPMAKEGAEGADIARSCARPPEDKESEVPGWVKPTEDESGEGVQELADATGELPGLVPNSKPGLDF